MPWSNSAPFGELLTTWRSRHQLTQTALAQALGAHRNTIGRWERGEGLPETKGMVLELARVLRLEEWETRQLLEASLTALVPYWTVPFRRNPAFTGRDALLQHLQTCLAPTQPGAHTQAVALCGLGGIGKTQLAVEYAYRTALEYTAVFWLAADTAESLMTSVQQIAEHLQLPERQVADQSQIVAAVGRWLVRNTGWLVIADNVEDPAVLHAVLPATRHGALLLTTQQQTLGTLAEALDVPPLSREEGAQLLLKRVQRGGLSPSRAEETAAAEIVTLLEGLPLALDQAGAYLDETGCTLSDYLRRYQDHRHQVLARRGTSDQAHPASVATTLSLSVKQVEQAHPAAGAMLSVCAFLHPDAIPEELLVLGSAHLGPLLGPVASDPYHFDQVLAALRHASLVTRHAERHTFSVHRLVQAVLQDSMEPAEARLWRERAVRMLHATFPDAELSAWKECERLLPHILTCTAAIEDEVCKKELGELLYRAGDYLGQRGRHEQAESLLQRARRIQEQILGPDHPQLATSLDYLARLCRHLGKYEEGEALLQQALAINKQALGPDHPEVARLLTELAVLYTDQGKYEQAEPLYARALSILAQTLGPEHLAMARPLNGLAVLRKQRGEYEQAAILYERSLRLRERAFGSEHPEVAMALSNLAAIYQEERKYEQAKSLYQQALRIWEQTGGLDHPLAACPLSNLAEIYEEQGQYEQAEAFSKQALRLWEQAGGPDHVLVAYPLHNLAKIAHAQRKDDHAEVLFKRALQIREQQLEPTHPEVATTLNSLATLYREQGKYEQAEPLYQRALAIGEQHLGSTHPSTMAIRRAYQELLERREAAGASERKHQEQAQRMSGNADPNTDTSARLEAASKPLATQFHDFLAACCDLDSHAWSRSSELWQVYTGWAEDQQIPLLLSRRTFANHLKAQGCHAGRTNTVRLWRGIAVLRKTP